MQHSILQSDFRSVLRVILLWPSNSSR